MLDDHVFKELRYNDDIILQVFIQFFWKTRGRGGGEKDSVSILIY